MWVPTFVINGPIFSTASALAMREKTHVRLFDFKIII